MKQITLIKITEIENGVSLILKDKQVSDEDHEYLLIKPKRFFGKWFESFDDDLHKYIEYWKFWCIDEKAVDEAIEEIKLVEKRLHTRLIHT